MSGESGLIFDFSAVLKINFGLPSVLRFQQKKQLQEIGTHQSGVRKKQCECFKMKNVIRLVLRKETVYLPSSGRSEKKKSFWELSFRSQMTCYASPPPITSDNHPMISFSAHETALVLSAVPELFVVAFSVWLHRTGRSWLTFDCRCLVDVEKTTKLNKSKLTLLFKLFGSLWIKRKHSHSYFVVHRRSHSVLHCASHTTYTHILVLC